MADFLLVLGKLNLALGGAIILVWLLRRPLRAQFGAPVAYALWLLVPVAGLAILLPPRVAAPPVPVVSVQQPAARILPAPYPIAQMPVTMPVAQPAPRVPKQPAEQMAPVPSAGPVQSILSAQTASLDTAFFDYTALLFAAWVMGGVLMALYLARLQLRFHATMRLGEAGPAVLGFFRPRMVMPEGFQDQFTAPEQEAILAHERVHLARQDARINALAALLRCICWFNPLVHLGAAWLRMDQELACDATALAGPVSRRDYANALLKSQLMTTLLPLGCNWPGSQHPLIERIELLKRKRPGMARRIAGAGLVVFAATCAGLGAWAAQPPAPAKNVPAKTVTASSIHKQIALAVPAVPNIAANQNAGNISSPPMADANSIPGDVTKTVTKPATQPRPNTPVPDSAEAQSLPVQDSLPEQVDLALNAAADMALAKAAADAAGALSKNAVTRVTAANSTTPAPAASSAAQTGNAPRPETRAALNCMLELGPNGCQEVFAAGRQREWALDYWIRPNAKTDFERGPLKSVVYVGSKRLVGRGVMDFYRVTFAHLEWTIYIEQPESDGKIHHVDTSNPWMDSLANARADASAANTGTRVEIAGPLQQARLADSRGDSVTAMKRLEIAEAVPNQTDEEKNAVARVRALVMRNSSKSAHQSVFPRCGIGSCDEIRSDPPPPN